MLKPFITFIGAIAVLASCSTPVEDEESSKEPSEDLTTEITEESDVVDPTIDENTVDTSGWFGLKSSSRFPEGIVLGEYFASNSNTYYFGKDGVFVLEELPGRPDFRLGNWVRYGDEIKITLTHELSLEGIGEPLPPPPAVPGNYIEQYKEYDTVVKLIREPFDCSISEIDEMIVPKDGYSAYEFKRYEHSLDLSKFILQLEKFKK